MMSFLLCSECFGWVQPRDGHCANCLAQMDSARPDPPLTLLRASLGDVLQRLGDVRVSRRVLPERGLLYATTTGVFFLPHEVEQITQVTEQRVGPSILWSIAALVWSPLSLVIPFLRTKRLREVSREVYRPLLLTTSQSDLLPELLMENPGAFFVPARHVRHVVRRRDKWIFERMHGAKVVFHSDDNPGLFHERMEELVRTPDWQHTGFHW